MPVPVSTQRCATAASTGRVTSSQVACTPVSAIDSASSPRTVSASSASAARPTARARRPAPGRRSAVPPVRARPGSPRVAHAGTGLGVADGRPGADMSCAGGVSGGGRRRESGVEVGRQRGECVGGGVGGAGTADQGAVHEIEAGQVVGGVAAVPAGGVVGGADAVAAVPGAQRGGGDTDPPRGRGNLESEPVGLLGGGVGDRDGWGGGRRPGHRPGLSGRGRRLHASSCGAWTGRATRPSRGGSAGHM